jgi:rare lipoprotein A
MVAMALAGCGAKKPRAAKPPRIGTVESGLASWYGDPYHGRRTASGEVYDMEKYTAAHRTLAFQTWVRVENLDNARSVDVRITDRGPFVDGRIIDLSKAAARDIDLIRAGTARVKLTVINAPVDTLRPAYTIQVGAFREKERADRVRKELESRLGVAVVVPREVDPPLWRVLGGRYATEDEARFTVGALRKEYPEAFVVRRDVD